MSRADLLKIWGYLEALKLELKPKANTAADQTARTDYKNMITEITELQKKLTTSADQLPE